MKATLMLAVALLLALSAASAEQKRVARVEYHHVDGYGVTNGAPTIFVDCTVLREKGGIVDIRIHGGSLETDKDGNVRTNRNHAGSTRRIGHYKIIP